MRGKLKKYLLAAMTVCMMLVVTGSATKYTYGAEAVGITGATVTGNKVELQWNAITDTKEYRIYRSNRKSSDFELAGTTKNTVFRDRGIIAGNNYYYRIIPVNSASGKENKELMLTVKIKAPQKVEISKLSVKAPDTIKIYWKHSMGANGYEVYRGASIKGEYNLLGVLNGSSSVVYTDETVVPGQTYYYKIRPTTTNSGFKGYGDFSSPIKGKTIPKTEITSIKSVDSNTLKISWNKVKNAGTYVIYRSNKENGSYKKIAEVSNSAKQYVDKKVAGGKKYYYKIVTTGLLNGKKINSGFSDPASNQTLQQVKLLSIKSTINDELRLKWIDVKGATSYQIYRSTSKNGKYRKLAKVADDGDALQFYTDNRIKGGQTYYYKVQAYSAADGIIAAGSGSQSTAKKGTTGYTIMGESEVTASQMAAQFKSSGRVYPTAIYKKKGAATIEKFCTILLDECEKEGVKAEVIFAQVCLETGYLSFGGQVKAEQCNFAGLGATDDGASGATFKNVRIGIRAQVQHLKGYASTEALNQECVDPRFKYLAGRRGTARTVQSLGNGNWATDPNYATKLMNLIKSIKSQ